MIQTLITDWSSNVFFSINDDTSSLVSDSDEMSDDDVLSGYQTPPPNDDIVVDDTPSPNWNEGMFGENVLNHRLDELQQNPNYDGYNDDSMDNF